MCTLIRVDKAPVASIIIGIEKGIQLWICRTFSIQNIITSCQTFIRNIKIFCKNVALRGRYIFINKTNMQLINKTIMPFRNIKTEMLFKLHFNNLVYEIKF